MEGGKSNFDVVMQPENVVQKPKRTRIIVGVVVGLVTLVVITAAVMLAVYFGVMLSRDSYKDAWKTYKMADGEEIVEKTEITEDEQDITLPNQMKVIYDLVNGIEVTRMKNPETGRYGDCYAKILNRTETDGLQEDGEMNGRLVNEYQVEYKATTERVPDYRISDNVREMCQGVNIFWMERIVEADEGGVGRTKRSHCIIYQVVGTYIKFYSDGYIIFKKVLERCNSGPYQYTIYYWVYLYV